MTHAPYKVCRRCRQSKSIEQFTKASQEPDGLGRWCKQCVSERRLERLAAESSEQTALRKERDREAKAGRRTVYELVCLCCGTPFQTRHGRTIYCSVVCKRRGTPEQQQRRLRYASARYYKAGGSIAWVEQYKIEHGCADCGFNSHSEALQFDHEGTKTAQISHLRWSIPKMLEEIKNGQCVVRCANCHAIRTRQRQLS